MTREGPVCVWYIFLGRCVCTCWTVPCSANRVKINTKGGEMLQEEDQIEGREDVDLTL